MKTKLNLFIACAGLMAGSAAAAPISGSNALPGGSAIYLPAINHTSGGTVNFDGATWSSTMANAIFGSTAGYSFGNGTVAPGGPPIMTVNNMYDANSGGYATMTLRFPTLTSGFLSEIFWTDGFSNANSANIAAYDSNGNLLDFFQFNNNGGGIGLPPGYYGFKRATADIAYINFSNGAIGARNLTWIGRVINAPNGGVPEPATWAMLIAGFGVIGTAARRQKRCRGRLATS